MTSTLRFLCFPLNALIPHYLYTVKIEDNILARRLRAVPPFFLRDSRAREIRERVKITPREKRRHAAGREKFFHARLRFARSTIPEEKWGTSRSQEP